MLAQTLKLLPLEDPFLHQLQTKIEAHLFDSELTVTKMVRIVGISRTNLHLKLSQKAGISASEFLRRLRLQFAAQLLLEKREWSVFQVALEVGFNSQPYFTVCFKRAFGCCPAAWRQQLEHL